MVNPFKLEPPVKRLHFRVSLGPMRGKRKEKEILTPVFNTSVNVSPLAIH